MVEGAAEYVSWPLRIDASMSRTITDQAAAISRVHPAITNNRENKMPDDDFDPNPDWRDWLWIACVAIAGLSVYWWLL
jgi:hypothetical protein